MPKETYGDRQGWIAGMPRFYIEQRIGCIAIVDSTKHGRAGSGFEENSPGVVWFRNGKRHDCVCRECGRTHFGGWIISEELIGEAVIEADRRNTEVNP